MTLDMTLNAELAELAESLGLRAAPKEWSAI